MLKNDSVNHPPHYTHAKFEVIEVIEEFKLGYHLGNVVKYILRHEHKRNPLEDLKKARWYLDRYIKNSEGLCCKKPLVNFCFYWVCKVCGRRY